MKPTLAAFALQVGISTRHASDLRARGVIPGTAASMVDLIKPYCEHLREQAAGRASDGEFDLTAERARLAHHQANTAELEERVKRGEFVPAEGVKEAFGQAADRVRAKLLAIPTKVAAPLAAINTPLGVADYLEKAIHDALRELHLGNIE